MYYACLPSPVPTLPMASAVFTGTVLFSTMILLLVLTLAIMRAAPSQYARSAALPAPTPVIFVGVFTLQQAHRVTPELGLTAPALPGGSCNMPLRDC